MQIAGSISASIRPIAPNQRANGLKAIQRSSSACGVWRWRSAATAGRRPTRVATVQTAFVDEVDACRASASIIRLHNASSMWPCRLRSAMRIGPLTSRRLIGARRGVGGAASWRSGQRGRRDDQRRRIAPGHASALMGPPLHLPASSAAGRSRRAGKACSRLRYVPSQHPPRADARSSQLPSCFLRRRGTAWIPSGR